VVPTFSGRLQTRLFCLVVVGLPWTVLVSLPLAPVGGGFGPVLRVGLVTLAATLLAGLVLWEPLYHVLMQFRWEKDWPAPFLLAAAAPEAVVVRVLVRSAGGGGSLGVFLTLFLSTWAVVFLTVQGPLRVLALRWRFRGARLW